MLRVDPLDELADLTRALRARLQRHADFGTWAAPGGEPPVATTRVTLRTIREDLGECTRCKLHKTRKSIVFGVGAEDSPLRFVGEAPGEQ